MTQHATSVRTYLGVFAALLLLLALTLAVTYIEHNVLGLVATLTIASLKAALILLFFMQIRFETPLIRMTAVAGMLWLGILIVMILVDLESRASESATLSPPATVSSGGVAKSSGRLVKTEGKLGHAGRDSK